MKRILVVDDELSIIMVFSLFLKILGYVVEGKTNPLEALEIFRRDPAYFDLIITDLIMPGMTGMDFSREVLKIRPDMLVVWCTGADMDAAPKEIFGVIKKPMSGDDIKTALERAFSSK